MTAAAGPRTVQGVYELGHALDVLYGDIHGFDRADIERIECFWILSEPDRSAAGFVVQLGDGRRAYIDFLHWHAFEQDEDFRIEVAFLPDDMVHPALPAMRQPPDGWSFDTAHLNKVLAGASS